MGIAGRRRRMSAVGAVLVASGAVLGVAAGDMSPHAVVKDLVIQTAAVTEPTLCCLEFVESSGGPAAGWSWLHGADSVLAQSGPQWQAVERDTSGELAVGDVSEFGLQIQTIRTARAVSELFPEINGIGGYRSDPLRWHPEDWPST